MFFLNVFFVSILCYLSLFFSYFVFGDYFGSYNEYVFYYFKINYFEKFFIFSKNINFSIILFLYLLIFSFYYSIYRRMSPRWRVYIANKMILRIRKGVISLKYSKNQVLHYLRKIDPFVFEEALLSLFQERGFKIKRNRKYTGDGGSDGLIWINGKKTHIQAKRYKSYINKSHMQEFINLTEREKSLGIFIHTGKTGKETLKLAEDNNILIISGMNLIDFLLGNEIVIFNSKYLINKKLKNK